MEGRSPRAACQNQKAVESRFLGQRNEVFKENIQTAVQQRRRRPARNRVSLARKEQTQDREKDQRTKAIEELQEGSQVN